MPQHPPARSPQPSCLCTTLKTWLFGKPSSCRRKVMYVRSMQRKGLLPGLISMVLHTTEKENSVWMCTVGSGPASAQLRKTSNESIKHLLSAEWHSDGTCYNRVEMTRTHQQKHQSSGTLEGRSRHSVSPLRQLSFLDEKGIQLFSYLLQAFKNPRNLRCVMFLEHKHSADVDKTKGKKKKRQKKRKRKDKPKINPTSFLRMNYTNGSPEIRTATTAQSFIKFTKKPHVSLIKAWVCGIKKRMFTFVHLRRQFSLQPMKPKAMNRFSLFPINNQAYEQILRQKAKFNWIRMGHASRMRPPTSVLKARLQDHC